MKRIAIYKIIVLFMILFLNSSCKKFVEVNSPSNRLVSATVFLDNATATAAITGIYARMSSSYQYFPTAGSTIYLGMYSDELKTSSTTAVNLEFAEGNLSVTNGTIYTNFWRAAYTYIYSANSCIEGLRNAPITEDVRKQLLGEAYFIRAYCYWNLITNFGDVPLVLTVDDYKTTALLSRTAFSEVVQRIVTDLGEAKRLLKTTYPTTARLRPNYFTASALLSRIHLYLENWTDVVSNSDEIIAQAIYSLEPNLNKVFLIGSSEAIWQLTSDVPSTNSIDGTQFIPGSLTLIPTYYLQPALINSFDTSDKRKNNWIAAKTVSNVVYSYPYKYKINTNAVKTEAQMMFRLGEIYLNRAEAKARLHNLTAIDDLNKTRVRAGLSSLANLTEESLITAIRQERRLELFAECGLRWFDLKRTKELDQVNSQIKTGWRTEKSLFPIPNTEILAAPNLTQNPGYY